MIQWGALGASLLCFRGAAGGWRPKHVPQRWHPEWARALSKIRFMSPGAPASKRQRADYADAATGLACGLTVITSLLLLYGMVVYAGSRDTVLYWATGQQLAHHANPYDLVTLGKLERAAGMSAPATMRNPPWALPLVAPLGHLGVNASGIVWTVFLLAVMLAAVWIAWKRVRAGDRQLAWLGYLSPVAISGLASGQTSALPLLGLALFLYLHRTRPFAAGAALWLCALKPHLVLPWATVLVSWVILNRAWGIFAGALTALGASCLATEWLDPAAWKEYLAWAHTSGIASEKLACVSVALRNLIDPAANWLTYVPAAAACGWAVLFFWKRRKVWDWKEHGSLVLLVSLAAAPYCWAWDQALAIPALMFAACRTGSRLAIAALAGAYIAIDIQLMSGLGLHSPAWIWLGPFWLVWYVWAQMSKATVAARQPAATAVLSVQ